MFVACRQGTSPVPLRTLLNGGGTHCCDCVESFIVNYLHNGGACHSCRALLLHTPVFVYVCVCLCIDACLYSRGLFLPKVNTPFYYYPQAISITIMCSFIPYGTKLLNHSTIQRTFETTYAYIYTIYRMSSDYKTANRCLWRHFALSLKGYFYIRTVCEGVTRSPGMWLHQ